MLQREQDDTLGLHVSYAGNRWFVWRELVLWNTFVSIFPRSKKLSTGNEDHLAQILDTYKNDIFGHDVELESQL
jgi:hypothetical protein